MRRLLAVFVVLGCGHESPLSDAPQPTDAPPDDLAVDAPPVDAAIDAPGVDAPLDAPPSSSPACTTAPKPLLDVSPRRIANIAAADHVLYVSAFAFDNGTVTNSTVEAIDLATEQPFAAPLAVEGSAVLVAVNGDVYASESRAAGTIWRLRPGAAPTAVITGRPFVRATTADADYLYWAEQNATSTLPDVVQRRLIAGGPIEPVTSCGSSRNLAIVGDDLYCSTLSGNLLRAPKAGGSATAIPYTNNVGITSMIADGGQLFFVNIFNNPELYRVPLPAGPAKLLDQLPILGRYVGLTASSDFFYTVEDATGIRRISRVGLNAQLIYNSFGPNLDPVLWNNQLYFQSATPTSSGEPLVLHCID